MAMSTTAATTATTPVIREVNREVAEAVPLRYLDLGANRRVAYRKYEGYRQPTILYIPGFFANMNLRKTKVIEDFAMRNGYSNVRYDQECVGNSTGSQYTIEFQHWIEDALAMVKIWNLT